VTWAKQEENGKVKAGRIGANGQAISVPSTEAQATALKSETASSDRGPGRILSREACPAPESAECRDNNHPDQWERDKKFDRAIPCAA
jgi:hypothetical protein